LQIAVAYFQIERNNYRGATKMFLRVRQWIDPLPDTCRGVDIAQLRADADNVNMALTSLGQERMVEFDQALLQPVCYKKRRSS
jgi:predicted metal-dependent hydrolase